MNIYSRELIEEYIVEIISRAQTISLQCEYLLSKDFASEAPKKLAKTLTKICSYLEEATKSIFKSIEWGNNDKVSHSFILLQTTDYIIREIGAHVRYVDGAQTQKLPWSFIRPVEKYIQNILPDIEIMLRPQWKYNYTLLTANLYDFYSATLSQYENYVPEKNLTEVLSSLNKSFYIVSFPSVERKNILLHCLIGHEIGHLLAKTYFTDQRTQEFLKSILEKLTPYIDKRMATEFSNLQDQPLFAMQVRQQITQEEIKRATVVWQRGLEEILSDIIGSLLFGPSVLLSTLEIALQDFNGLDKIPSEDSSFYPPWRLRLRNILAVLKDLRYIPLPEERFPSKNVINSVTDRFNLVEMIVKETLDIEAIAGDQVLIITYEEIKKDIEKAKEQYMKESRLKDVAVNAEKLYEHLYHLIERIDCNLPPNAYEKSINEREPAHIVDIITATWFHRLSWEEPLFGKDGSFNKEIFEKRDRMNRLSLKAVEYSDIESSYIQEMGRPEKYEANE